MHARLLLASVTILGTLAVPRIAQAQAVQISRLSDVAFGTISNVGTDQIVSQSVCAYSGLLGGRYSVSAAGSGAGGAYTLSNGSRLLPYEVQWNGSAAGQTSGTSLASGATLTGQTMLLSCPVLAVTNSSLIVILRGTALSTVTAGSYSGTLTVILSAN